ncbi:DUF2478 domain-containing protein [Roseovarius sp. MMSF_3281]|uniref:DUF2478 domain-containing protein n=1 Tax=Roseovarius sp. MMSF_3281 TaxID=3046694 RepID=UPI00273F57ED|nr:DUF2478 domain-containing protein [Roseovarius sp. MMSF_3281]
MNIAYTMSPGRGDTDLILARLAGALEARGIRCRGTVQINTERPDTHLCDMDVMVLPKGPVLRISQNLGANARGCRLDPSGLEASVGLVEEGLTPQADLLIINKFGKHEAEGRGFRDIIGKALAMEVSVLVGLNAMNKPAFEDFAGDLAVQVEPTQEALLAWVQSVTALSSPVAV